LGEIETGLGKSGKTQIQSNIGEKFEHKTRGQSVKWAPKPKGTGPKEKRGQRAF